MAIRIVVPMEAASGKRDELIGVFRTRAPKVRQESGCEEFELYQSTERPDQLILLELWADEDALKAHSELNKQRVNNVNSLRIGGAKAERYTAQP